jgi:hypothetical protein
MNFGIATSDLDAIDADWTFGQSGQRQRLNGRSRRF